ncbi:MAG TPA: dihydrodipicolinate synthase family protein [Trebonia sp.]|nr:dihydrodipicolinate synthase family protein [Trebonia sp.]
MADVVLAAVPTPFAADGSLDTACARRYFAFIADRADGMLVAGTTGEFPALDDDERLALVEIALEVAGPDRVIAHIGAPDAYRAARLARQAVLLGARRIAAITPYYLAPSFAEVTDYYLRIREAAPAAGLYAYIFPERTVVTVTPSQFCELADTVGLAGAKFSGSAARSVALCASERPGLRIFSGDDSDLAATLRSGGAGIISARSAAYPEVFMGLAAALAGSAVTTSGGPASGGPVSAGGGAASAGRGAASAGGPALAAVSAGEAADAAAARQADVQAIAALGASIGLVKEALRARGFGPMAARMPVNRPDAAAAARVRDLVKALGLAD